jgi:hypothetical protein
MGTRNVRQWFGVVAALLALLLAGSLAAAQQGPMGGTPGAGHHGGQMMDSTGNGVIYLTVANTGDEDDALVGGRTDRAELVEIHEMMVSDGTARMQPVDGPLPIPAGETVVLEPGGLHLMLINLTEDNRAGDVYEVTLEFARAGEVILLVPVKADADGDPAFDAVQAGDLEITGAWSRPSPRLGAGMASPMASPEATPHA